MTHALQQFLVWSQTRIESKLSDLLQTQDFTSEHLKNAVSYSVLSGGKRVRPALVYGAAKACGGIPDFADNFAAAVEAIHCYSLIHDDLPAMDDDELRRGKPTNHIIHGEAMAILAGDLLQSLAFKWISQSDCDVKLKVAALETLSEGAAAMVDGQALDIAATETAPSLEQLEIMHRNKTGALIVASLKLGGIANQVDDQTCRALKAYGESIGLAFQVKDDILDVEADTATLGKQQGADANQNKPTYVSLLGLDGAKNRADQLLEQALEALVQFDEQADVLRQLANYIVSRQY